MSSQSVWNVFAVVTALICLQPVVHSELTVTPWEQSAQLGRVATFVCSDGENQTKAMFLTWSFTTDNSKNISKMINSTGRVRAVNGTLTLSNLTYEDAGRYRCSKEDGSEPGTGVLVVYAMPDYLKEGLIIAGISAFLLIVVLTGVGVLIFQQSRQQTKRVLEKEKRLLKKAKQETGVS